MADYGRNWIMMGCCMAMAGTACAAGAGVKAVQLCCEYLSNPLAVGLSTPRLSWRLEASDTGARGARQTAYQILAASSAEKLVADTGDLWDSGKVEDGESLHHPYQGPALAARQRVFWKVRVWDENDRVSDWSAPAEWAMGLLSPEDWGAQWIGVPDLTTAPDANRYDPVIPPSPMLRRTFSVKVPITRAVLYVTGRGDYECRINGQRVGDHLLAPEWTDYLKRIQYQAYDVTAMVRPGDNALGAMLGDGWYLGRLGPTCWDKTYPKRGVYGKDRRLLARLEIECADGTRQTVTSDGQWKGDADGPIRSADNFMGEAYDARKAQPGWDAPGFDDAKWKPVLAEPLDGTPLIAQRNEPIRIIDTLKPRAVTEPKSGAYVFDMGQNFAGWCRVRLSGQAGQEIVLRHGEMLNPDGTLYTENLRAAAQIDRFVLAGGGEEVFEPHFTYHGFRYVEVTGLISKPDLGLLEGQVISSSVTPTGAFECSDPMLTQLFRNSVWTLRANLYSVPTDCPQRDERMGWTGDAQVFAQSAIFEMDMAAFFTKWIQDLRDAQAKDGSFPDIAPHAFDPDTRFKNAPGWADAGIIVPWRLYENYGDLEVLRDHIDSAKRFIDGIERDNPDLIWKNNVGNNYGDWLNGDTIKAEGYPKKGGQLDKEIYATAFFAHSTSILSKMCAVLGLEQDATRYRALAGKISQVWRAAYMDKDGRIKGDTQAGYALALHFGLVPEPLRAKAVEYLVEGVKKYDNRISTGFHSTYRMMLELSRGGQHDLACALAQSKRFPSWGYTIEQGATTIWERWDGYVAGRGFQDVGMNSFSHYAIGAVTEWMYRELAGINLDEAQPGYKQFVLRPRPGGSITSVKAKYDSIRGPIESEWKLEGNEFQWTARIPANTSAEVYVPCISPEAVKEGDVPAAQAKGLEFLRMEDGAAVYCAVPGMYHFRSTR